MAERSPIHLPIRTRLVLLRVQVRLWAQAAVLVGRRPPRAAVLWAIDEIERDPGYRLVGRHALGVLRRYIDRAERRP